MSIKNLKWAIALAASFLLSTMDNARAEAIKAYTAVLPPFTLGSDQDMPGISHELLEEMSKRSGVAIDIEYLPWKRAQAVAQTTPNALLFTTSRTASRETTYTWIAEMIVANEVFATTSGAVNSVDDARSLKRIATLGGTPREKYLLELGFADLQSTTDTATAARLLTGGRVDAWYTFNQRVLHAVKEAGIDPNTIIIGAPVRSSHMWLAANAEFDAAVADKLAQALAEMRSDGTYDVIVNKYVN